MFHWCDPLTINNNLIFFVLCVIARNSTLHVLIFDLSNAETLSNCMSRTLLCQQIFWRLYIVKNCNPGLYRVAVLNCVYPATHELSYNLCSRPLCHVIGAGFQLPFFMTKFSSCQNHYLCGWFSMHAQHVYLVITHLQGDILTTAAGGTAVVFNDVEVITQKSPGDRYVLHCCKKWHYAVRAYYRKL